MKPTDYPHDLFPTEAGDLIITMLGHGSLMFQHSGRVIYVDPYSQVADFSQFPPADIIFITHEHEDHFDLQAIASVRKQGTIIVLTERCALKLPEGPIMKNGDEQNFNGLRVRAVPAYNIIHHRESGLPYHHKGFGNGYVLDFGGLVVYVAGDTENIPEMVELDGKVDVAFLPMNLPYTMTPEMVADAVKSFNPRIVYPYHYGSTETHLLVDLLAGSGVDVRIRP
jgi:L-ascorbate metabolism protein UlaG (beta-lactamase superfamily)